MSEEELIFLEGFVYPLILLIIGGGITGLLIPYFNRMHESKLKRVEIEKEEAQKRIDREREDYKFELNIKDKFFTKMSEENAWCFTKFKELRDIKDKSKSLKIVSDAYNQLVVHSNEINDILNLYFQNAKKLREQRSILEDMIAEGITLADTLAGSEHRKKEIENFNKRFDIKMSEDEIKESIDSNGIFKPLFSISRKRTEINQIMLKTKIDLSYRD